MSEDAPVYDIKGYTDEDGLPRIRPEDLAEIEREEKMEVVRRWFYEAGG